MDTHGYVTRTQVICMNTYVVKGTLEGPLKSPLRDPDAPRVAWPRGGSSAHRILTRQKGVQGSEPGPDNYHLWICSYI